MSETVRQSARGRYVDEVGAVTGVGWAGIGRGRGTRNCWAVRAATRRLLCALAIWQPTEIVYDDVAAPRARAGSSFAALEKARGRTNNARIGRLISKIAAQAWETRSKGAADITQLDSVMTPFGWARTGGRRTGRTQTRQTSCMHVSQFLGALSATTLTLTVTWTTRDELHTPHFACWARCLAAATEAFAGWYCLKFKCA